MNNEIKELLDFIKEQIETETLSYEPDVELSKEEAKKLLDYITNLQEENEKLKEYRESYRKELDFWRIQFSNKEQRIDKAIEYINKHLYMESSCGIQHPTFDGKPSYDFDCFELENILNGGDEE